MDFKTLLSLKAKSPLQIVQDLAKQLELEKGKEKPAVPLIGLYLHSGYLEGYLLDYNREDRVLLLALVDGPQTTLKYVEAAALIAVEVLKAKSWIFWLTDGTVTDTLNAESVPSWLQLKAQAKAVSTKIESFVGIAVTVEIEKDDATESVQLAQRMIWPQALQIVQAAIGKVAEDAMGKEALSESVAQISLHNAEDEAVMLADKTLTIAFNLKEAGKRLWKPSMLQEKIEEKL